jgi:hypothetical protein
MVRDVARRVVRGNKLVATHALNFNLDNLPLGLAQRGSNNVEDRESILRALGRLGLAPSQPSFTTLGGRRRLLNTTAGGGGVTTPTEAYAGGSDAQALRTNANQIGNVHRKCVVPILPQPIRLGRSVSNVICSAARCLDCGLRGSATAGRKSKPVPQHCFPADRQYGPTRLKFADAVAPFPTTCLHRLWARYRGVTRPKPN